MKAEKTFDTAKWLQENLNSHEGIAAGLALDLMFLLEARRSELGLSYAELARRMGVSRQHVHKLMSGTPNISLGSMAKLSLALGCGLKMSLDPQPQQLDRQGMSVPANKVNSSLKGSAAKAISPVRKTAGKKQPA